MSRLGLFILALCLVVSAQETAPDEAVGKVAEKAAKRSKPVRLKTRLRVGDRFTGANVIRFSVETKVRQGETVTTTSESQQRTERFVDKVRRVGYEGGTLEIERSYLQLFTKGKNKDGAPRVHRSPMQGRTVSIIERNRRRDVKSKERGVDPFVRRTAGLELDWRDVFPADPVRVGDSWKADADSLAHRLAAYFDTGAKSLMRARLEEIVVQDGAKLAKLYVDWTIEGMRDRRLFTKVTLAGDVFLDMNLGRVVNVDLEGTMIVRGAIIGEGQPQIVKGDGPVSVRMTLKPAPIQAAVDGEDDE